MLPFLASAVLPAWHRRSAPPRGAALTQAQGRILRRLVLDLGRLPVGHERGLTALSDLKGQALIDAFRQQVPTSEYADYQALIDRVAHGESDVLFPGRALALAQTSGTTRGAHAGERYVPQSLGLLAHHHSGGSAALARVLGACGTHVLGGRLLFLGGSTALAPGRGVPVGDLSGIVPKRLPAWARGRYEPGPVIAAIPGWPERMQAMAERLATADVRLCSGIASWLLMLYAEICGRSGRSRVRDAWPGMRAVIHGGHPIDAYIAPLSDHLAPETWMQEVYPASEAFIALGSRPWRLDEGQAPPLEPLTGHGVFLEFQPDGERVERAVGAECLEAGQLYRVLVTTPGGLVRYQVGDLVRGCGPGLLRFAGRVRTRLSLAGEHVEGSALDAAAAAAAAHTGSAIGFYHVAPIPPDASGGRGRHEWWVEFARAPVDIAAFAVALDRHLRASVIDYEAHRAAGQLLEPGLVAVPPGTFRRWLELRRRDGGQHKVPQAWTDRSIADQLAAIIADHEGKSHAA